MGKVTILTENDIDLWQGVIAKLPSEKRDVYFSLNYLLLDNLTRENSEVLAFVYEANSRIAFYPFIKTKLNGFESVSKAQLEEEFFDIETPYGYGGPLFSEYDTNFVADFFSQFSTWCENQNIVAEFTRFHPLLKNDENLATFHYYDAIFQDRNTVYLDLSEGYDAIWENEYSSKNRNMIRKALKSELAVGIENDGLEKFMSLYHSTMARINAQEIFFYKKDYFDWMRTNMKETVYQVQVKDGQRVVGAILLFLSGDYCHYHLSSRDVEYSKYAVTNLALDYAIKFAIENGCKKFHFGGGNSADENDGLYKFKSNFSKNRGNFVIAKKVHNEYIYSKICSKWEEMNPDKVDSTKNFLLKYRL